MNMDLATIPKNIGVCFEDENLLLEAVTHSSCLNEPMGYNRDNLALAWLGDALIRWVVSEEVYRVDLSKQDLHDLRKHYVVDEYLTGLARGYCLDEALILPQGQENISGRRSIGNLHTVFEAVVGAVYRDQGYEMAQDFVMNSMFKI